MKSSLRFAHGRLYQISILILERIVSCGVIFALLTTTKLFFCFQLSAWEVKSGRLISSWARSVSPGFVWPEYPRPQFQRNNWLNLNGLWDYTITESYQVSIPSNYDGKILVPFCIESALSGVMESLLPQKTLWYHRKFNIPKEWKDKRVLLNFGAVDWECTVYVNGRHLGKHQGGYDSFVFDITDALRPANPQEIVVSVKDPTDSSWQLRGKQSLRPAGCNYTACSGIWQTVWLEAVNDSFLTDIKIDPRVPDSSVFITVNARIVPEPMMVEITVFSNSIPIVFQTNIIGKELSKPVLDNLVEFFKAKLTWQSCKFYLKIENPRLWNVDDPFLYDLRLVLKNNRGEILDEVFSYFGMREIKLGQDAHGRARAYLNGKLLIIPGALDQGYWPDGIYTAPTDEALRFDIEAAKRLGLVAVRKHVKVEPQRWYYWADKLGLLVFQDMPSGNEGDPKTDLPRSHEAAVQCMHEKVTLVQQLYNHPSIICWIIFNEGWGQHDTLRYVDVFRTLDPSRLIDEASGFPWHGGGDVADHHGGLAPAEVNRIGITSEDGGWGLACPQNQWSDKPWTYRTYDPQTGNEIDGLKLNKIALLTDDSKRWFTRKMVMLFKSLWENSDKIGMTGVFYCQLVDVENECNGLLSYDRKIWKVDPDPIYKSARNDFKGNTLWLFPKSQSDISNWKYTTNQPSGNWISKDYDDSMWALGAAPFGAGLNGVKTEWHSSNIWLRVKFYLNEKPLNKPMLLIFHDEDVEVFINGILAFKEKGFLTGWDYVDISGEAAASLNTGTNSIAVHCSQSAGAQFIDVSLVSLIDQKTNVVDQIYRRNDPINQFINYTNALPFSYCEGQTDVRKELRDPCIIREGGTYYLVFTMWPFRGRDEKYMNTANNGSSPGIAIYSTTNFLDWRFERWLVKSSELPDDCPYKHRFWAPEIHKIHGKYFLIFTADNWLKKEYNPAGSWGSAGYAFVGVSDSILGPYTNITYINGAACDTSLFEDIDGKTYAIIPRYNIDIQEIDLSNINKKEVKLLGKPKTVVFATNRDAGIEADADYLEGPWLERINGKYWLFYAATHRNENYQDWLGYWTCAAVADSVLGPYKKIAGVKLFMGGHASVFKSLNGGDWFCFRNESKGPDHGLLCIQSFYVDAFSKIIFPGSD